MSAKTTKTSRSFELRGLIADVSRWPYMIRASVSAELPMPKALKLPAIVLALALAHWAPSLRSAADANWPGFRGPSASGIADGQELPDTWNGATGTNLRWKVAVPGLAHSSPIVWGDRIFLTSAISSRA